MSRLEYRTTIWMCCYDEIAAEEYNEPNCFLFLNSLFNTKANESIGMPPVLLQRELQLHQVRWPPGRSVV